MAPPNKPKDVIPQSVINLRSEDKKESRLPPGIGPIKEEREDFEEEKERAKADKKHQYKFLSQDLME